MIRIAVRVDLESPIGIWAAGSRAGSEAEITARLQSVELDLSALDAVDRITLFTLYSMMVERSQRHAA